MSRYRKIDTRIWGDVRFRELSSPPPSGKYLWLFLLSGPQTSNIPGLFRAGEMALAEELGWSLEGFRKAFAEPWSKGLVKADWNARVVWVQNAIKYNAPENPNVVKSWSSTWDDIPECALKLEAYERLKAFTEGLGKGFAEAFVQGCGKGMPNQEQEQEQDKTSSSELENRSDPATSPSQKKTEHLPSKDACRLAILLKSEILRNNADHKITSAQERQWVITADRMLRLDGRTVDQVAGVIQWAQRDEFWMANVLSMDKVRKQFDQLLLKMRGNGRSATLEKLPSDYVSESERIRTEQRALQAVAQ
jgi:hypothetical protein